MRLSATAPCRVDLAGGTLDIYPLYLFLDQGVTVNMAIGYCTPPMGVSLYITGAIAKRDLIYVSKAVLPFIVIQIAVLLLLTFLPDVVLWLPKVMGFIQ